MIRIVVDDQLLKKILEPGTPVQLCDSAGNDIAIAWPGISKYAGYEEDPVPDEAEIRRILAGPKHNVDEVLAWLEKK